MAIDQNTESANYHFLASIDDMQKSSSITDKQKQELVEYYEKEYLEKYNKLNTKSGVSSDIYFKDFDTNTWLQQYHYIFANPHPVGEKHNMEAPLNEFSSFSNPHGGYHRVFLEYADKLGYGDIYLIGADGRVNYSLKKGFELGTSVVDGPYANSGLGRAFRAALKLKKGEIFVEDFNAYAPLFGSPAAFISTPMVKFRKVRGVLVVQLPIDIIDSIMTNDREWEKVGLGKTGEAYLVGPDYTLRNISRLKAENPELYIQKITEFNDVSPQPIDEIVASSSNIGLQKVVTKSTEAALSGNSGFGVIEQFDGRQVISAYSPINVEDFNWAIVSEIDYDEAFESTEQLSNSINYYLVLLTIAVICVSVVFILFLAQLIFKPINTITEKMHEIADGNGSLASRLDESGDNEISHFANGFNSFVSKLAHIVDRTAATSESLIEQSDQLITLSQQGKDKSLVQKNKIDDIIGSIDKISHSIGINAEHATSTSNVAVTANEKAQAGKAATSEAIVAIQSVAKEVNNTAEALKTLEEDSNNVSEVLSVIDSISNQTNLLALNAAIEAARAGENGRGFAVVADEVRSLSHKIQKETHSIYETINKLQEGTMEAVEVMQQSIEKTNTGVELSTDAGKILDMVVDSSRQITEMNEEIATTTQDQNDVINIIESDIESTAAITNQATQSSIEIDKIGNQISLLANELQQLVGQFSSDDNESQDHDDLSDVS
jgi:methyl-accepting chemotaxis protein